MSLPASIDHLVLAATSLEAGIAFAKEQLGVSAVIGGRHPQWGTHNALLSLGGGAYLEILAPDPAVAVADAENSSGCRLFGLALAARGGPCLTTWMLRASPIEVALSAALRAGVDLGEVRAGSRRREDGSELRWQLAVPRERPLGGTVPWLIDWCGGPHPSASAPAGCKLEWIELEHPEPARVRRVLAALGCQQVRVSQAAQPAIVAGIACPRGIVVLRTAAADSGGSPEPLEPHATMPVAFKS